MLLAALFFPVVTTVSTIALTPTAAHADDDDDFPVGGVEAGVGGMTSELPESTLPVSVAGGVMLLGAGAIKKIRRK